MQGCEELGRGGGKYREEEERARERDRQRERQRETWQSINSWRTKVTHLFVLLFQFFCRFEIFQNKKLREHLIIKGRQK